MIQKKIKILNKLGLHARAAAKFVAHAARFSSELQVSKGEQTINGKSIMGVMMLAASKGTELNLLIDGEDEQEMLADLEQLVNDHFGEAD